MSPGPSHLTRPRRNPQAKLLGQRPSGKLVFINFSLPNWVALSPPLAMLLSLCDGQRDLKDLAAMVQVAGGPMPGPEMLKVMKLFSESGLLEGPAPPPEAPALKPLTTLALYVTRGCNLRCRYCFVSATEPLPGEMNSARLQDLMRQFQTQGGRLLQFLGGEPLLRPDIIQLGQYSRELGLTSNLITNGTLLDAGLAPQVAATFDTVQVSLDGLAPTNDHYRGKGSYDRAVAGLRHLLALGVNPTVSTVVSQGNIEAMDDFLAELVGLGVGRVHFVNLQSCGRGRQAPSSGLSSLDFGRRLLALWQRWGDRLEFPREMLLALPRWQRKTNCGPAEGMLEVDPRGLVYPCYYFMERNTPAGDLNQSSLLDIYHTSPQLGRLRDFSVDRHPRCAGCDYRYLCGGGCLGADSVGEAFCQDMIEFINWVILQGREMLPTGRDDTPEANLHADLKGITAPKVT